jgi:hydroxymethylglutaryl-CoA lyase
VSDLPNSVHLMEVGPRDGLQMEKRVLAIGEKLQLLDALADAGLREIEVGSFVNPKAVPQMADTAEVFAALTKRPDVRYRALWLNRRGLETAMACQQVDLHGKLSITTSETFIRLNTNRSIDETYAVMPDWLALYRSIGITDISLGIMTAFGCNYEGAISEDWTVALIDRARTLVADHGARLVQIDVADTTGWAHPLQVKRLIGAVRMRWPDLGIKLHLHDTRGAAVANAVAALELGVAEFDGSIGGLGGCPFAGLTGAAGNICTEDLAFVCEEMGIATGLDLEALCEAARLAQALVGRELPGKLFRAGACRLTRHTDG